MICYYQNSKQEKISLTEYPYRLITGGIYDYEWDEITYSSRIYGFSRKIFEKELKLDVFCGQDEFADRMNDFESIISVDIASNTPGRLYVNGEYLSCYVNRVKKDDWEAGLYTIVTLGIISDYPFWVTEMTKQFFRKSVSGKAGTGYNFNYPFNYPWNYTVTEIGSEQWHIDHVSSCPFTLTIYGPVTNPRILINGHPYEIYTTLEGNEYLILDTRTHKITKYLSNSTTSNLYNSRRMEQSVFDPIGPGPISVNWSGTFGFDITAYIERNEPTWQKKC